MESSRSSIWFKNPCIHYQFDFAPLAVEILMDLRETTEWFACFWIFPKEFNFARMSFPDFEFNIMEFNFFEFTSPRCGN